jgi:CDP-diacylglycerol--serine O-phosphatidyltransferase
MKKHIPNAFTMMNLFSGCIALSMAFSGSFSGVVIWVLIAAVFDFFDGFAARLLGVSSPLGKELDSLADVVSFGVAPASAVFVLLRNFSVYPPCLTDLSLYLSFTAYLIPVFSALRLGKFNLDEKQTSSFLGLPTPANALFWISYCYGVILQNGSGIESISTFPLHKPFGQRAIKCRRVGFDKRIDAFRPFKRAKCPAF